MASSSRRFISSAVTSLGAAASTAFVASVIDGSSRNHRTSISSSSSSSSSSSDVHREQEHRQKRGALYLSCGPSGAGKDTLLLKARAELAGSSASSAEDRNIAFLQRVITRDASKCTSLEIPVSDSEFAAMEARGELALSWRAHGTSYGIPKAALEEGLAAGKRLVANVSRTTIDTCLERYGPEGHGHEVYCLLVTADDDVLRQRLLRRGRESQGEVEKRVARAKALEPRGPHVIKINNVGTRESGVELVLGALRGTLKYSLWLLPSPDSATYPRILRAMRAFDEPALPTQQGGAPSSSSSLPSLSSSSSPSSSSSEPPPLPFDPHLTLCASFRATPEAAVDILSRVREGIAHGIAAQSCELRFRGLGGDGALFFRSLVLEVALSPELAAAHSVAKHVVAAHAASEQERSGAGGGGGVGGGGGGGGSSLFQNYAYAPHVSLKYGPLDALQKSMVNATLEDGSGESPYEVLSAKALTAAAIPADQVALVMTTGKDFKCWAEVARMDLQK